MTRLVGARVLGTNEEVLVDLREIMCIEDKGASCVAKLEKETDQLVQIDLPFDDMQQLLNVLTE